MAVIEIGGHKLETTKLMKVRIPPEKGEGELRLILPSASWNTSGKFLLHSLTSGRVTPVDDVIALLEERGLLKGCLADE